MSKFLVVGLGNIGEDYDNTRHNIGFQVLDNLAAKNKILFSSGRYAQHAELKYKGKTIVLIKPSTFMNLSGKAVNYWLQTEKISVQNLLVITDDIALPFGSLRMKIKGSDGGHNGLKNIQETLNTTEYPRLRFGVGSEFNKGKQSDYVLGKWSSQELLDLQPRIVIACEMVLSFVSIGIQLTMTNYNKK